MLSPDPSASATPVIGTPQPASVCWITAKPGIASPAATARDPELLDEHLGRVVVARAEHLRHDIGDRCRRHRRDRGRFGRGDAGGRRTADRHATLGEQRGELARRTLGWVARPGWITGDASVVDDERVVRAGLDATDVVAPAGREPLVVVARAVSDDRAVDALHTGGDDRVSELVERRRRRHRVGVVADRVLAARQQRVAATDEVEVSGHDTCLRRHGPDLGRVRRVRTEDLERNSADEQLLVAGGDHRAVGTGRPDRDTVEGDGDARRGIERGAEVGDRLLERRQAELASERRRSPPERQQRRRECRRWRRRCDGCRVGCRPFIGPPIRPPPHSRQHQGGDERHERQRDDRVHPRSTAHELARRRRCSASRYRWPRATTARLPLE